jgi:hypothetical protein
MLDTFQGVELGKSGFAIEFDVDSNPIEFHRSRGLRRTSTPSVRMRPGWSSPLLKRQG